MTFKAYKKKYSRGKSGAKLEIDASCCICVQELSNDCEVKVTPCGHFFHHECLFKWIE